MLVDCPCLVIKVTGTKVKLPLPDGNPSLRVPFPNQRPPRSFCLYFGSPGITVTVVCSWAAVTFPVVRT
jgi:hypothetical protein